VFLKKSNGGFMALSEKLIEKLACPSCRSKLEYDEKNEKLICQECQVFYKVNNDVPVLLIDEAEKL
jgi:uncharacterized protein YbaR (Trm112 family)